MDGFPALFAYLGPETMLPLTSVVAGVAGVLLMMGKTSIRWCLAHVRRLGSALGGLAGAKRRPVSRIGDLKSR